MRQLFLMLVAGILLMMSCKHSVGKGDLTYNAKTEFKVGMHCTDCEQAIKKSVGKLEGIVTVDASYKDSTVVVAFDSTRVKDSAIVSAISDAGYKVDGFAKK